MGEISIDRDAVVEFTRALVRIPSVNRPADGLSERPAAELVAERMRSFGWEPAVEEVAPGRPNVVAVVEGGLPGPTLLFEGHTDVVTEGDPAAWSHPPFAAEVVDGRLYGRGSADMKAGVSAMLHATAAVAAAGPFPGRIVVAALVDEEGMMLGVKDFVARGHADAIDAAIVCEPEAREVCIVQKGALRLRVHAAGEMAHGAMPDQGVNPLPALARVVTLAATAEAELQESLGEHEHLGLTYVTPTVLQAGSDDQLNVIPRDGWVAMDVRTVPGVDHERLRDRICRGLRDIEEDTGVSLRLEVIEDRPPTETDPEEPVVRALVAAHEQVRGEPACYGGVPGTTDGTILWRDAGIPVVVYGPGGKWIAHQVDEYVEIDDLIACTEVYARAARSFLTGGA